MKKIKVMVVDNSGFLRSLLTDTLNKVGQMHVVATARYVKDCLAKIPQFQPDVITLDIETPVLDGLTALQEIMTYSPTPVIMASRMTK